VLEEQAADEEAAEEQDAAAVLDEHPAEEEQDSTVEVAAVLTGQPVFEVPSIDGDPTVLLARPPLKSDGPGVEDAPLQDEEQAAEEHATVETRLQADPDLMTNAPDQAKSGAPWDLVFIGTPLVQVGPSSSDDELDWSWNRLDQFDSNQDSALGADGEDALLAEPDEVAYPSLEEIGVNGWTLYVDVYQQTADASEREFADDGLNWEWDWGWDADGAESEEQPAVVGTDDTAESLRPEESGSENGHGSNGNGRNPDDKQDSARDRQKKFQRKNGQRKFRRRSRV
jgi:hypothetical protein